MIAFRSRLCFLAIFFVAGCAPGNLGGGDPDSGISLADAGLDGPGDPPADASPIAPFWYEDFRDGNLNNGLGRTPGTFSFNGLGESGPPAVSTDMALTGGHSVKFTYRPGPEANAGWPELRFNLPAVVEHLWVRYWLHVPANIEPGAANKKFFIIDNEPSTGSSTAYYDFEHWGDHVSHQMSFGGMGRGWIWPGSKDPPVGREIELQAFPSQWIELVFEIKRESAPGARDPVVRIWVNGEKYWDFVGPAVCPVPLTSPYGDWCQNHQSPGINGFIEGYFMGWANAAWSTGEPAVFYIDRVEWFDVNPDPSLYR